MDSDADDDEDEGGGEGDEYSFAAEKKKAEAENTKNTKREGQGGKVEDEGPGSNEFVQVTAPEGDVHDAPPASRSSQTQAGAGPPENVNSSARGKPTEAHELKHEGDAPHEPLHQTVPKELHEVNQEHLAVDNDGGGRNRGRAL